MTGVLYGLAKFCVRHRFVTIAVWLLVTIALVAVSHSLGENTNDNLSLPGTDSQHATDTLSHSFPDQANGTSPIVLHAAKGKLTEAKYASAVNEAAADVAKAPHVASVVNPLTPAGRQRLEQGQVDRLPVGDTGGLTGRTVRLRSANDHRRGQPGQGGRTGGGDRRAARPEGLQNIDRVQRADRDRRGDGDPDVHVRHGRLDAATDSQCRARVALDARNHPPARARDQRADRRPDARDDDRAGRGHRLRAVHCHPPPARTGRRARRPRVDRARGGDLRRSRVLRRLHCDDRARIAGGGQNSAGHDDGPDGGHRGGRSRARRTHADAGAGRDSRPAHQLAARAHATLGRSIQAGRVGQVGRRHRQAPGDRRPGRTGDPAAADDPAAVAEPRAGRRGRAFHLDHRAARL